jgi:hypothetical protein
MKFMKFMPDLSKLFEVIIETVGYKWSSVIAIILDPD